MRSQDASPTSHHLSVSDAGLSLTRSASTTQVLTLRGRLLVMAKLGLRLLGAVGSMRPPPLSTRKPAPHLRVRRLRLARLCVPSRATYLIAGASRIPSGPRSPGGPARPMPPLGPVGPEGPSRPPGPWKP